MCSRAEFNNLGTRPDRLLVGSAVEARRERFWTTESLKYLEVVEEPTIHLDL